MFNNMIDLLAWHDFGLYGVLISLYQCVLTKILSHLILILLSLLGQNIHSKMVYLVSYAIFPPKLGIVGP